MHCLICTYTCTLNISDMGANINTKNSDGSTVLHEAVLKGNMQMIEYLLKNGAEVNIWMR